MNVVFFDEEAIWSQILLLWSKHFFSVVDGMIIEQAGCIENTRDFPSKEIPRVFSITQPALFIFTELEILPLMNYIFYFIENASVYGF